MEKKNSFRQIFFSYLNFLGRGGKYVFGVFKWAIYNFGMHGVVLAGKIKELI